MDRAEMQRRELELIDAIVLRGIQEHKTAMADYPILNNELIKIDAELYPEEE